MRHTLTIILTMVVTIGLSTMSGCGTTSNASGRSESIEEAPVPVRLSTVEYTNTDQPVRAVGRLEAKEELRLSFKTGGIIDTIYVDDGVTARKGQLLASLRLTEVDAQLAQAQNAFDKTERDLIRMRTLYNDSAVSLEQFQNATTAWELSKAALNAATFNRKHAKIYAPSDGRILRKLADNHEQVAPGSPVLILAGFGKGWIVRAGLADRDILRLKVGDSAEVVFDALPGLKITGHVSELGAAPNPMNGTYEVEIRIDQSVDRLVSGLIGKLTVVPSSGQPMTLVPVEALVEADGSTGYLFVPTPEGTKARKLPVTISYIHDGKIAIPGDLVGVKEVVTAGATKLKEGTLVTVVR